MSAPAICPRCRFSPIQTYARECPSCHTSFASAAAVPRTAEERARLLEKVSFHCSACKRSWEAMRRDVEERRARGVKCTLCAGALVYPFDESTTSPAAPVAPAVAERKTAAPPPSCPLCERSGLAMGLVKPDIFSCPLCSITVGRADLKRIERAPVNPLIESHAEALAQQLQPAASPYDATLVDALRARARLRSIERDEARRIVEDYVGLSRAAPAGAFLPVRPASALELAAQVLFVGAARVDDETLTVDIHDQPPEEQHTSLATFGLANAVGLGLLAATGTGFIMTPGSRGGGEPPDRYVKITAVPAKGGSELKLVMEERVGMRTSLGGAALRTLSNAAARGTFVARVAPHIAMRRESMRRYCIRAALVGGQGRPAAYASDAGLAGAALSLGIDLQVQLSLLPRIDLGGLAGPA